LVSLMRTHLLQAYRNAEAITLLEEALASGGQEAVWLTPGGRIRRTTSRAPKLLENYFGRRPHAAATQLPDEVSDWLQVERRRRHEESALREPRPLVVANEAGRLTIRWFARSSGEVDLLALSERRADPALAAYDLGLTPREIEVLRWVIRGQTSAEIALLLGMSRRTVETHLNHMYRKLGVTTRAALVALALQAPDSLA
ncbi:MAG TPA: LuxR C-terminal-related transcriptional regulator, partial [Thermomicrobiaceae bacterium]|nr:LuxR C-terminal-related transcriptional regulator [Thermomicrobiaceae bacterium]